MKFIWEQMAFPYQSLLLTRLLLNWKRGRQPSSWKGCVSCGTLTSSWPCLPSSIPPKYTLLMVYVGICPSLSFKQGLFQAFSLLQCQWEMNVWPTGQDPQWVFQGKSGIQPRDMTWPYWQHWNLWGLFLGPDVHLLVAWHPCGVAIPWSSRLFSVPTSTHSSSLISPLLCLVGLKPHAGYF